MADPHRPAPVPPQVTTPLLTLITQQSLDEDYLHAAERRVRAGEPPTRGPHRLAGAVIAVFGLIVAVAAVQTERNAPVDDAGRQTLVSRILERRDELARRQDRIAALQQENAELGETRTRLGSAEQSTLATLRQLQVGTGTVPVRGPGLRLQVRGAGPEGETIRKEDLFLVINGLWAAGAEAVSLDGHRLNALSWISNSDVTINVDLSPLAPPYSITAIGDPRTLGANLIETDTFTTFAALASTYGFAWEMEEDGAISMPAARTKRLVSAQPGTGPKKRADEEDGP